MSVRDTALGAIAPGDPVAASTVNDGAGGLIGAAIRTTDSASTTTSETILTVAAVPINASRTILCQVQGTVQTGIPCHVFVGVSMDDVVSWQYPFWSPGTSATPADVEKPVPFNFTVEFNPSAGTHDFGLVIGIADGSGAGIKSPCTGGGPAWIRVFDSAPSF